VGVYSSVTREDLSVARFRAASHTNRRK
jgi:hypothetical protein